ncbi:serine/threonine-protein kinase SBK1-like isoform X2 [Sphaeramia orbicularis]|uniref:serine/threonine-protein kinase SBK1-like isoform X2 n=1 Tax=Sphaeramia orbicularis TaxID=375764 RepID=UPI00118159A2|nr:serine/threonine-protein kinase SBK1-like isoform X2 [Sphaeramia orbicularis]
MFSRGSSEATNTMTAATKLLDELCHVTAQSLCSMDTDEHFHVLKLLGEGSYGKVMLAMHRKRGTPMALKFFPRIAYSTPSHYIFAQQPSLFGDLYDVITPEVGMEEDCCQRVVSQLCGALSHLHRLGFVHRDLKPENIFLCDAACRWVKLGDFGMVKARGTKVPEVWYSSPYCTPEAEVARGNQDSWREMKEDNGHQRTRTGTRTRTRVWVSVEPSTDSWALGILTYAMLTGSHPWAETSGDCRSYLKYRQWVDGVKSPGDGLDVWAEPQGDTRPNRQKDGPPVAPQFTCFTPLACSLFLSLLDPRPKHRGQPEDMLAFLGGQWMVEKERERLEEERKKSG